jgi:hypothetical protein
LVIPFDKKIFFFGGQPAAVVDATTAAEFKMFQWRRQDDPKLLNDYIRNSL